MNRTIEIEFLDCKARVMLRGENVYLQANGENLHVDKISKAFIYAYIQKMDECKELKEQLKTVIEMYQAEVGELEC